MNALTTDEPAIIAYEKALTLLERHRHLADTLLEQAKNANAGYEKGLLTLRESKRLCDDAYEAASAAEHLEHTISILYGIPATKVSSDLEALMQ